ncbi:hypothetical protein B0T17DRAFT_572834 [Bombardia bombarda]|uniref:Uncharacterized protein n=1 Tax=Bombardia bombarda TaxID=252184 RepID=A0AA40CAV8_9PEZI|nr:hypothetical protein B0T17DRAFT_572834 [Bombardia bombarda]
MVKINSPLAFAIAAITHLGTTHASPPSISPAPKHHIRSNGHGSHNHGCPPLNRGSFAIDYFQLYAENADWDEASCLVWFGSVWNATVAIYDPYTDTMLDVLSFPGTSYTGTIHIGGVARDPHTGLITILTDSARPWETAGADVSGDHLLMKYSPYSKKILWTLNITAVTRGRYGAFQDVEHDKRGNTYVVGTFPGTVMRADREGRAVGPWYLPEPFPNTTTRWGFSGLAAVGGESEVLLANDGDGRLYRFDMREAEGRPVLVPTTPEVLYTGQDAIYLPPMYGGRVLLVASHDNGIQVLRSRDRTWRTAENLGLIPSPTGGLYEGGFAVAPVQIGSDAVYLVDLFWDTPWVPGTVAGNRSLFPMKDITSDVERLLRG